MISTYLSQHDHVMCTQVCKALKTFYNPLVWRHIKHKNWSEGGWTTSLWKSMSIGAFTTNAQHIQSLQLGFGGVSTVFAFARFISSKCPHLTSLEIFDDDGDYGPLDKLDEAIAKVIDSSSAGLKRFVFTRQLDFGLEFGPRSTLALFRNTATLEFVRMEGAAFFGSKNIQRLLCSAPKLKELNLLRPAWSGCKDDGHIEALDMVESEWVCTNLEVFECEIGGIPHPRSTFLSLSDPGYESTMKDIRERNLDLHRKVYSQLGRLTKLRELKLGSSWSDVYDTHGFRYTRLKDCLEMTLDSGLDLLRPLKELERMGLDEMDVYIGRKELAWMKEHWPKLKSIKYGVPWGEESDLEEEEEY
ncbi:hypothetical protein EC991_002562 [Linnemannia zychae]|nr:hypothetical protein EC991_002562 [Linnemannia zychae]